MAHKPFLKWAGGKRWFVQNHDFYLPKEFNRYIEPFLGSGAVFFHLQPNNAILGDSNPDLIETYQAIKDNWKLVYRYLKKHHKSHSKEYYYMIRASRPLSPYTRAARIIYLNRTCWNGLYRVNEKGIFNVPIGTRSSVISIEDNFEKISTILSNATLVAGDFEKLIDQATNGDFIFADPPYTVRHNNNGFVKYNEKIFSWYDQERLALALNRAKKRGAFIVSTNACHESVKKLYEDTFNTIIVSRNSSISSKVSTRKNFDELIIHSN
ncbi:Dam family site-specific DNA-(adenine-N6)-methyltransferase [Thiothrix unzii]|uniref:DNA adenine methylase n=1 Tax=Thiothrix unzii TaxID=111769 RepID=UPI002A35A856|nr:Dam family site-specific DNA-(adenine-N6)-methyltransferase [Thiothrix unzii]MDX9987253.1 Dam family site-specific DNA-(adenine-N6)-methyltransferase [Thiothrix unzii]